MPPTAFHRYIWVGKANTTSATSAEAATEAAAVPKEEPLPGQAGTVPPGTSMWLALLDDLEASLPEGYLASVVFIDQWPEE